MFCLQHCRWAPSSAFPSGTGTPSSNWLPISPPTPHLKPSNSGSPEYLVRHSWGSAHGDFASPSQSESAGGDIWSLGRGKSVAECGMEQPPLYSSTHFPFLFLTWTIILIFSLESPLRHYYGKNTVYFSKASFYCGDVWHVSYQILTHSVCHCGVPSQR